MKMCNLFGPVAVIVLAALGGCSASEEYCCKVNDDCGQTPEGLHSCSNDTCGQCVPVFPLAIDFSTLPDAAIGQSNYSFKLTASGGISPYTWSLDTGDNEKLKWLTITKEGDTTAIFHNSTGTNGAPLYPAEPGLGIPLKITVVDSSQHENPPTEDSQGKAVKAFDMTININCLHGCQMPDGISPPTVDTGTKCVDGQLYNCVSYLTASTGTCLNWDSGSACMCNNDKINCCQGDNVCAQQSDKQCKENVGGTNAYIYGCIEDTTTGCFVFGGTEITQCEKNLCSTDGISCGTCETDPNYCSQPDATRCTTSPKQEEKCVYNQQKGCNLWTAIDCGANQRCANGGCNSCAGCWDNTTCLTGNEISKCGIGGGDCAVCPEDSSDGKKCAVTSCASGQCNYRYIITTENGLEEVKDTLNSNTYWKRRISVDNVGAPIKYTIQQATTEQCIGDYEVPSLAQLKQIVETKSDSSHPPMINSCAFPNTPWAGFWSSDDNCVGNICSTNLPCVNFETGNQSTCSMYSSYYVRCVRKCCSL